MPARQEHSLGQPFSQVTGRPELQAYPRFTGRPLACHFHILGQPAWTVLRYQPRNQPVSSSLSPRVSGGRDGGCHGGDGPSPQLPTYPSPLKLTNTNRDEVTKVHGCSLCSLVYELYVLLTEWRPLRLGTQDRCREAEGRNRFIWIHEASTPHQSSLHG